MVTSTSSVGSSPSLPVAELCNRGHELTEDNVALHKRGDRPGYRKRCLACKRESYNSNGQPTVYMKASRLTTERHEDVEDLIKFGATYEDILQRAGFASWDTLYRSLKRRDRWDLIEKLREKKSRPDVNKARLRDAPNRKKQGRRRHRQGNVHELPKEIEEVIFEDSWY